MGINSSGLLVIDVLRDIVNNLYKNRNFLFSNTSITKGM